MKKILLLLVFFSGCILEIPFDRDPRVTFIPGGTGTWWNYTVTRRQFFPDSTIVSGLTVTVLSSRELPNGEIVSVWALHCPDTVVTDLLFNTRSGATLSVHQTSDSVFFSDPQAENLPTYLLRLPLRRGSSWQWAPMFEYQASVDSVSRLYTPAGIFDSCYRVRVGGGWWQAPEERLYWFRPSVGLIRGGFLQSGLINYQFTLELQSKFITRYVSRRRPS